MIMNNNQMIKELAEENRTRKILEILKESESLNDAIEKVRMMLEK